MSCLVSGAETYYTDVMENQAANEQVQVIESVPATYHIEFSRMEYFTKRIEKLNKTAAKLKVSPVAIEVVRTYSMLRTVNEHQIMLVFAEIRVHGIAPKIAGWVFAGTIEHLEGVNILRSIPGQEIPEAYRHSKTSCAACNKDRSRKDTYVVKNEETSEFKQLGKSCLRDYTGHVSPQWIAQLAELDAVLRSTSEPGEGGRFEVLATPEDFLTSVYASLRERGSFYTKEQARVLGAPSTASQAMLTFTPPPKDKEARQFYQKWVLSPTDADRAKALEALSLLSEIAKDNTSSSFNKNVASASLLPAIADKHAGILACVVLIQDRANVAKLSFARPKSVGIGSSGEKIEVVVRLQSVRSMGETRWSEDSNVFTFEDSFGNKITWFSSKSLRDLDSEVQNKQWVVLKATVKKHTTYKEDVSTVVIRPKFSPAVMIGCDLGPHVASAAV